MKGPQNGGAGDDVSSVPASVATPGQGMSPHVRSRFGTLARYAARTAEQGKYPGAALALLSDLAALGVLAGSVTA